LANDDDDDDDDDEDEDDEDDEDEDVDNDNGEEVGLEYLQKPGDELEVKCFTCSRRLIIISLVK